MITDTNIKPAKMDNPSEGSSNRSPRGFKIEGKLINTDTQEFEVIRNMPGFVDHTRFIQSFLKRKQNWTIFAPRGFGKSSHLNMVKRFLQIEADEKLRNGPPEGRTNYHMFEGTDVVTNDKYNIVEEHLGKHPVIHLDFKQKFMCVRSIKDAEMHCRIALHKAYLEHSYLITNKNQKLHFIDASICKMWCDPQRYKLQHLWCSLERLTKLLSDHFDKAKVYILVDGFDAINATALRQLHGNDLTDTVKTVDRSCDTLRELINSVTGRYHNNTDVGGVLITGESYVTSPMSKEFFDKDLFENMTRIKFLGDDVWCLMREKSFVPFYGATEEEIERLVQKLVLDQQLIRFKEKKEFFNNTGELDVKKIMVDVQSRYGGYFDPKGTHIFCLPAVLQYLETGEPKCYLNQISAIEGLDSVLCADNYVACDMRYYIMKLIAGEEIRFKRHRNFEMDDIVKLHNPMMMQEISTDIIFSFMLDQGYFSCAGDESQSFKVPNSVIRSAFSSMIGIVVEKRWEMATASCTSLIEDISLSLISNEQLLQMKMLLVHGQICEMLRPLNQTDFSRFVQDKVACTMFKTLLDAKSFEYAFDLVENAKNFLLLHRDEHFSILFEVQNDYFGNEYRKSSLYALQEARGITHVTNRSEKKYMKVLKELGRRALTIGLSIDRDINVSLSYSLDMEEKIFTISEREPTLYPNLYNTYKPVLLLQSL